MSIKIKSLAATNIAEKSLEKGYLYKDLALDLSPGVSFNNQLNKKEYLKDVSAIYDVEAIKNSIKNCFLTSPGQKILNPTFGIDLRRYLFEPVDNYVPDIIRLDIENNLPRIEPRITLQDVNVVPNEDEQQYEIYMQINVPSLNIYGLTIKSELKTIGYSTL